MVEENTAAFVSTNQQKVEVDILLFEIFNPNSPKHNILSTSGQTPEICTIQSIARNITSLLGKHDISNKNSFYFARKLPDEKEWGITNFQQRLMQYPAYVERANKQNTPGNNELRLSDVMDVYNLYLDIINYGRDIESIQQELNQKNFISQYTEKVTSLEKSTNLAIDGEKKKLDEFITSTRRNIEMVQISEFADFFRFQKNSHVKSSLIWLGSTVILFFLTIAAFFFLVYWQSTQPQATTAFELVHYYSNRLLLLGFGIGATLWCANIYRTEKNLQTVYAHKEVSVNSFKAFVLASESPEIKDAILMEITKAVFSLPNTGYAGKEDNLTMLGKMLDMVKSVNSKKSGS